MQNCGHHTGTYGHILLASGLLGGLCVPIISFQLEKGSVGSIVNTITSSTQLGGALTILYATFAICTNKSKWIEKTYKSTAAYAKLFALWILGIILCTLRLLDNNVYQPCGNQVLQFTSKLSKNVSLLFIVMQILFISWCSRYIFLENRKLKYIMALLVVTNMINWLEASVLSISLLTDSNITYINELWNCSIIREKNYETIFQLTDMLLLPSVMEFSILATTIVISILCVHKKRKSSYLSTQLPSTVEETIEMRRHFSFSGKQKLCTTFLVLTVNAPFIFYIVIFPFEREFLMKIFYPWVVSVVCAKVIIFVSITIAFYNLYKRIDFDIRIIYLNFNDLSLFLCSAAVVASGVVNFLLQMDTYYFLKTFHTWFNIIYILYQTIFISFFRFIDIRSGSPQVLNKIRIIVIILIIYNLLYWVKDSLFYLSYIQAGIRSNFARMLFFVLYPFQSFYRFQSAMGLIPLNSKLRVCDDNI